MEDEGPTTIVIKKTICNGCKHLRRENVVFGSDFVRADYSCAHPIFGDLANSIVRRSQDYPNTPHWCPVLALSNKS